MDMVRDLQTTRRYAVLGTGAVGGFYGARLQHSGQEVHFLVRGDYEQVRQRGLIVESPEGNFTLPQVNAYPSVTHMPPCDVVIVALKTTQNDHLTELLPPVVKPDGVVLLLQNGLGMEPQAAKIAAPTPVLGGLCFVCSNKIGPGHIRHLDYKKVTLGQYADHHQPCGITEPMRAIAQDLEAAGIPVELAEDLYQARWKKLVWNIPFNGLSVVLNATTDEMMADPQSRALAEHLMQEVVIGAAACGRVIPPEFIETMLDHTAKMKPYRTSMKIDYDEQRPLEIEAILGNPIKAAQAEGARLPQIEMLYQQLKFLDTRNRGFSA